MGDVYLTYDERGKAYFRRWVYLNILLLIVWGIIFLVTNVDVIFILLPAAIEMRVIKRWATAENLIIAFYPT